MYGKETLASLALALTFCAGCGTAFAKVPAHPAVTPPAKEETAQEKLNTWRTQKQLADEEIMALLWMRNAAEYRALCYQGYNTAMVQIDKALQDPAAKGKKLAIVLDCDETVLDNTPALAKGAVDNNGQYKSLWWRYAVHKGQSLAMPGAAEFLQAVDKKGLDIFYVTNRLESFNYDATEKNLKDLKFPQADRKHILLMKNTGDKNPRYDAIRKDYEIVLYMGDSQGDFPLPPAKSLTERNAQADAHQKDWGSRFIIFPNPVYGSWVSAIAKNYLTMTPEERSAVNREFLLKHTDPAK